MYRSVMMTRFALGMVGLFLFSLVMSCQELKYMVQGKRVDASSFETHVETDQENGRSFKKRVVGYSFMDGTTFRREYVDVPVDWDNGGSGTLKVEYIPGWERHSRLVGQNNRMWVVVFFMSLVAAGGGLWGMSREGGGADDS